MLDADAYSLCPKRDITLVWNFSCNSQNRTYCVVRTPSCCYHPQLCGCGTIISLWVYLTILSESLEYIAIKFQDEIAYPETKPQVDQNNIWVAGKSFHLVLMFGCSLSVWIYPPDISKYLLILQSKAMQTMSSRGSLRIRLIHFHLQVGFPISKSTFLRLSIGCHWMLYSTKTRMLFPSNSNVHTKAYAPAYTTFKALTSKKKWIITTRLALESLKWV